MVPEASYKKIARFIKKEILEGKYVPGDRIPSENKLATLFNVSRMTARKAIDNLVYDGVLIRIPGLGTYVAEGAKHIENKRFHVGILMDDLSDTRGISISSGITRTLLELSVHPIMTEVSNYELSSIEKEIKLLITYGADGIILTPKVDLSESKFFLRLIDEGFPIVFIDRGIDGIPIPVVESANYQGGKCLGKHLKEIHGSKKVLFVSEEGLIISSVRERYEGLKDGLGKEVDFLEISDLQSSLENITKKIVEKSYDVVAFCHDLLAVSGMSHFLKNNIEVPKDIKITGFDDRRVSQYFIPNITTVRQDFNKMGSTAALFLVKLLKGEKVPKREKIPIKLIIRESCGCKVRTSRKYGKS